MTQLRLIRNEQSTAELSACERYRYSLGRQWTRVGRSQLVVWVMLNPSTANADEDDATIRKIVGFAKKWNQSAIHVVNLFALRSTDPDALKRETDPVGGGNNRAIEEAMRRAGAGMHTVICAWGAHAHPLIGQRVEVVRWAAERHSVSLLCLGKSKLGAPLHPLYLPYNTLLESWS